MYNKLLINEYPLQVLPSLAKLIGLNESMFLQQVHFFTCAPDMVTNKPRGHEKDGRYWTYNSYEGWHEMFPFWSVPTIKRIVKTLRDAGLIITTDQYNKIKMDKTLWYTIDYNALDLLVGDSTKSADDSIKMIRPEDQNDPLTSDQNDPTNTLDSQRDQPLEYCANDCGEVVANEGETCSYCTMLIYWQKSLPSKPCPRSNNQKFRKKADARLKDDGFRENWRKALDRAGQNLHLKASGWFDFEWFTRNDENYAKILNGVFDGFHRELARSQKPNGNGWASLSDSDIAEMNRQLNGG